ncbi:MAG TPA: site-specific integrase [Propionibacteriaceae bacterium]|jgi:integrase
MAARRGKGEGGITQRHDHATCPPRVDGVRPVHRCQGRWVGTLPLPDSDLRKTMYGRTRKEVKIKLDTARRDRAEHILVTSSPTVETWLRYWLDTICVERGLKTNTLKSHRSKVEQYLIPHLGRIRLDRLAPEHLRRMYAQMREQGLAEATLRQAHAVLRRALEVAVRERKAARNVAALIDPPKTIRGQRQPLSLADAQKVLHGADLRWYVALYLGLRQGEALALRWSDVNLDQGFLVISRSLVRKPGAGLIFDTPKSVASHRAVPLPVVVLSRFKVAWAEHLATGGHEDALIFNHNGAPLDHRADWQAWADQLSSAGVPHVALHAARNTAASLLEQAGVPDRVVAQILGQTSVKVTHGYQNADLPRLGEAMKALEGLLAPED